MRLKIIRTSNRGASTASALDQLKSMEADVLKGVEYVFDPGGPGPVVEDRAGLVVVAAEILKRVVQTNEEGGFDAIVIQGGNDPIIMAAREVSRIPVVCCGHAAMHVAAMIGNRFSILEAHESMGRLIQENATIYGLASKLASIRCIEASVPELMERANREHYFEITLDQARKAILEDGADTVILGTTSMGWMCDDVKKRLWEEGLKAQVVYPYRAAISMAKAMVEMGLCHSDLSFPGSSRKPQPVVLR